MWFCSLQSSQCKGQGKMDFIWGPTIPDQCTLYNSPIKTAYIQFCTDVATQAVHISTIIRARSLYFTPIKLTDTRMHCIFRLRATGHHHFGHNTVKYIELCVCPHQWQHRVK